ncbi:MAG: hypothetical protein Q8O38_15620 [Sulfurimicrobium sp.]|nr:hypothetical protein [Sulfurimicrobium sp.]
MAKKLKARTGKDRRTLKLGRFADWMERRSSVQRRKPQSHNNFF